MHELNNTMQLVSTFAYVYFKDVAAPLESVWDPMRGILKKTKYSKQDKKGRKKKKGQLQTHYAKDLYSK